MVAALVTYLSVFSSTPKIDLVLIQSCPPFRPNLIAGLLHLSGAAVLLRLCHMTRGNSQQVSTSISNRASISTRIVDAVPNELQSGIVESVAKELQSAVMGREAADEICVESEDESIRKESQKRIDLRRRIQKDEAVPCLVYVGD
ncbi:hypothetical protein L2E82_25974 [Cichorium intybus]|uniref:Uncharacterized protein n=1 Tax=Cichorium intybus TaxID=13427 RepID=A0ACB9E4J4_CICIN|nr:hypothetical protein L2E82_25974 [Cichorium intybus]